MSYDLEVNDLSQFGSVRDLEGYMLPPEVFTFSENFRVCDGAIEALGGVVQIFGTPLEAPHFVFPVVNNVNVYWLYTSLTKAYVWDGAAHHEITRTAGGNYAAADTNAWQGTMLGGIPILNNGTDVPQYWSAMSVGQKLQPLPNWPAAQRAKHVRAFINFLIALNVMREGIQYPHMVQWSNPAVPGAVPTSWDSYDENLETGETDLADVDAGVVIDGLPLRGQFFIYKEASIWRMAYAGGRSTFNFDTLAETAGAMAPKCVAVTGDGSRHFVKTHDDLIVHDGRNVDSIVDRRYKRFLANDIDTTHYGNSFCFCHPMKDEMWFCYPESGERYPTRALVWNYREAQKGVFTEANVFWRSVGVGTIESSNNVPWDSDAGAWDAADGPWGEVTRRQTVLASTDMGLFLAMDKGDTRNGTPFTRTIRREGLAIVGKKRDGSLIVDVRSRKMLNRVWLKAEGAPFYVRTGAAEYPRGPVTWQPRKLFTPATDRYLDFETNGPLIAIEFASDNWFKVFGYKAEFALNEGDF